MTYAYRANDRGDTFVFGCPRPPSTRRTGFLEWLSAWRTTPSVAAAPTESRRARRRRERESGSRVVRVATVAAAGDVTPLREARAEVAREMVRAADALMATAAALQQLVARHETPVGTVIIDPALDVAGATDAQVRALVSAAQVLRGGATGGDRR